MKSFQIICAALACAALPQAALAQSSDDPFCREGRYTKDASFTLATVVGEERAYFYGDMDGCPDLGEACRSSSYVTPGSYVIAGDIVVISKMRAGFGCAFFPNKSGGNAGWIKLSQLAILPSEQNPSITAWTGDWSDGAEEDVHIAISDDRELRVTGNAFWRGLSSIHIGEVDGDLLRFGNRARYDEDLCVVDFTLLGDYLLIGDNSKCGGANVSFNGIYRRTP